MIIRSSAPFAFDEHLQDLKALVDRRVLVAWANAQKFEATVTHYDSKDGQVRAEEMGSNIEFTTAAVPAVIPSPHASYVSSCIPSPRSTTWRMTTARRSGMT